MRKISRTALAILLMLMMEKSSLSQAASLRRTDFVELQRTSCEGSCPVYSVRIYADGRVLWDGLRAVKVSGNATARVAPAQARKLIEQFRTGGFWDLRDNYLASTTDLPGAITILHIGKREKRVVDGGPGPVWFQILGLHVDSLANTHQWIDPDKPPRKLPNSKP